jgi:hypothetical protein
MGSLGRRWNGKRRSHEATCNRRQDHRTSALSLPASIMHRQFQRCRPSGTCFVHAKYKCQRFLQLKNVSALGVGRRAGAEPRSLTSLREKLLKMREGRQPRALRDLPDGRGRGVAKDVRRHPIADHATTEHRPRRHERRRGRSQHAAIGKCALIRTNAVHLAFHCRQTPDLITSCLRRNRFLVAEAGQKHDPGFEIVGIWQMSVGVPSVNPALVLNAGQLYMRLHLWIFGTL